MEAWTNGELHVIAGKMGVFLVRGTELVVKNSEVWVPWQSPLAVDVANEKVWTGRPLTGLTLSDLTVAVETDERARRVAVLPDGRLAAIVGDNGEVNHLLVGQPGAWERKKLKLGPFKKGRKGVSQTKSVPKKQFIGYEPYITTNEHGVVLSDGSTGVVVQLNPSDMSFENPYLSGGAAEHELFGYAFAEGLVVTTRWAAREATSYRLIGSKKKKLAHCYGGKAIPTEGLVWHIGDAVQCTDYNGKLLCEVALDGFVQAAAAHGNVAIAAGEGFVHVMRFDEAASEVSIETVALMAWFDLVLTMEGDVDWDDLDEDHMDDYDAGMSVSPASPGKAQETEVTFGKLEEDDAKALAEFYKERSRTIEIRRWSP